MRNALAMRYVQPCVRAECLREYRPTVAWAWSVFCALLFGLTTLLFTNAAFDFGFGAVAAMSCAEPMVGDRRCPANRGLAEPNR